MNPHLLLGAALPFFIGVAIYVGRGFRASFRMLILVPPFMALGMAWASAPDIPRLLGFVQFYNEIHTNPRINVFMWHYSIDLVETESSWYVAGFVLLFVALVAAALRELFLVERGN